MNTLNGLEILMAVVILIIQFRKLTRIEIFMLFTTSLIVKSIEIFALVREIALSEYNFKRFSER